MARGPHYKCEKKKIVTVGSSGGSKLRHKSKGTMKKSWIHSTLSKWSGLLRSAAIC